MAMSKPVQDKVRASSWQGQGQGKVKERIRQGKIKVKARLRGKFNNSNSFNEYQINFYRSLTPLKSYNNKNHNNCSACQSKILRENAKYDFIQFCILNKGLLIEIHNDQYYILQILASLPWHS